MIRYAEELELFLHDQSGDILYLTFVTNCHEKCQVTIKF